MDYNDIARKIIELKNADMELRDKLIQNGQLGKGFNEKMEQLHTINAGILNEIIDKIGYPTIDKVGKEANEGAWLVIQHSISHPDFMKKCAKMLKIAVSESNASPKNLAYLTDRIAVFENRPQLFGTQFDWDKSKELSPNFYDDLKKVNQRRKEIGLNTLEEQTDIMRKQAKNENHFPPVDFEKRKLDVEHWKRKVGWIK
ncbi:DUF6624 domain-containing protein [Maribellus mangrovi]|uniref:DUF6624 domain-containing protein n=1 Tax=Maribellus mangrovi TaxID=3133146 RepID=UPI0030ED2334